MAAKYKSCPVGNLVRLKRSYQVCPLGEKVCSQHCEVCVYIYENIWNIYRVQYYSRFQVSWTTPEHMPWDERGLFVCRPFANIKKENEGRLVCYRLSGNRTSLVAWACLSVTCPAQTAVLGWKMCRLAFHSRRPNGPLGWLVLIKDN